MIEPNYENVSSALHATSPEDRDWWVKAGAAVYNALGEPGYVVWRDWSSASSSFAERDAMTAWKSFRRMHKISVGTLFYYAKRNGWTPRNYDFSDQGKEKLRKIKEDAERRRAREAKLADQRAESAAVRTARIISEAERTTHPYLAAKGFGDDSEKDAGRWKPAYMKRRVPEESKWLVHEGDIIVPMYSIDTARAMGYQRIKEDGSKKFLPFGARVERTVMPVGCTIPRLASCNTWWCEGLATALSIQRALKKLYRQKDAVVIAFSAQNLRHAVRPKVPWMARVIADNDKSGTGERYAKESGLPYWMPPEVGQDANDYEQQFGTQELAERLRALLVRSFS